MAVVVKTDGIPFWWVGEFTTHFRLYFTGDWDVHWGYDLAFEPWPCDPWEPINFHTASTRQARER